MDKTTNGDLRGFVSSVLTEVLTGVSRERHGARPYRISFTIEDGQLVARVRDSRSGDDCGTWVIAPRSIGR